jgi:hypothetical protein
MNRLENYTCVILIYSLLFWLLVGCQDNYASVSFVKVESERTKLISGIESYQNIAEFKSFLSRSSFKWKESEDNQPSPKGRPPFNMSTIMIKNFSHLEFSGELIVSFFNNRLISTTFYPSHVEKYIKALGKTGIKFGSNQEVKMPPHTRVRFATDHKGRKYIDWSDIRLDKEVELWIKRYS